MDMPHKKHGTKTWYIPLSLKDMFGRESYLRSNPSRSRKNNFTSDSASWIVSYKNRKHCENRKQNFVSITLLHLL